MSKNNQQANGQPPSDSAIGSLWHHRLAIIIFVSSFLLIALIVFGVFLTSSDKDKASELIITSILPVIGAWVGAVIAFYFSSKNLESATNSVRNLFNDVSPTDKLKSIPIKDKMILRSQMIVFQTDDDKIPLYDIISKLDKEKKNRAPVLDSKNYPRYVIHRSIIDKFLTEKAINSSTAQVDLSKITLADLISDQQDLKHLWGTISEDSTLAEAKKVMDGIKDCQDLFVTKNGTEKEEVTGWMTNVIIEDNLKV